MRDGRPQLAELIIGRIGATRWLMRGSLRDYARLGRLLAHDGAWEGRQLIPPQWLLDATTVPPGDAWLAPGVATPYFGYGYQTWLFPGQARRFALLGIRGQIIFVDPASNSSWCTRRCARTRRTRPPTRRRLRCVCTWWRSLENDRGYCCRAQ
jgi:hypothetical protein